MTEGLGGIWGLAGMGRRKGTCGIRQSRKVQGNIHGLEAQSGAAGSWERGVDGTSADWGDGGGCENDAEDEGRRSPVELKGWRVEEQTETPKSAAEEEHRLTEAELSKCRAEGLTGGLEA